MVTGRKKSSKKNKQESGNISKKDNYIADLKLSMKEDDADKFLRIAEKITGFIDSGEGTDRETALVKEKIHLCRYGGAPLSSDEMQSIVEVLEKGLTGSG